MNRRIKGLMVITLALACSWSTALYATNIYKTYDENGDPIYTDQPPSPDAKPISLRGLSVVEAPDYGTAASNQASQPDPSDAPPTLNEMRRTYRNFRLVSPAPDQNIWGTGNVATIAWDAGAPLAEGMGVIFYLDGQVVEGPTTSSTYTSGFLDRGAHTAAADLVDSQSRVLVSAPDVTFYIMQQSVNGQRRR